MFKMDIGLTLNMRAPPPTVNIVYFKVILRMSAETRKGMSIEKIRAMALGMRTKMIMLISCKMIKLWAPKIKLKHMLMDSNR